MRSKELQSILVPGLLFLAACGGGEQPARRSIAQAAEEITRTFETPEPYTPLRLDSLEVLRFLETRPEAGKDSAQILEFYAGRGFQYAWFLHDTLSATADAMLNLLDPLGHDAKADKWRALVRDGREQPLADSARLMVELGLTAEYFDLAAKEYDGYIQGDLRELGWYIPRFKKDYTMLLDSLVAGRTDLSPMEPVHPQYNHLKFWLRRYMYADTIEPFTPFIFAGQKVDLGDSLPLLCDVRHRLFQLGDLWEDSITNVMDSTLFKALVNFQERHGLKGTGILDGPTAEAFNVPIGERMRTLLVNMERLRWVNPSPPKDHLLVNIPEYRLHVFEEGKETWGMKVVVGAVATRTVIFSGEVSVIAFAPYWNVPASIVRNEIVPAMRRNPGYLAAQNMEVLKGGAVVPASSIDWATYAGGGGYSIRQKPGPRNSLGLVKFLFPNEYSIYLHDTPARSRFEPAKRAFSHGCIRLSEPVKLAEYLLRNDSTWTPKAIEKAMHAGREQMVDVKPPMPVTIAYFTAWVDGKGRLNFRDDVYGHDARLARELFAPETMQSASADVAGVQGP